MTAPSPRRGEVWIKSRLQRRLGTLSPELIDKVNSAIKISLDIDTL